MKLTAAFLAIAAIAFAADLPLGKPLTLAQPVDLATLLADPTPQVDHTVQVKGKITEVCQMMGCWMMLTDDKGNLLRIEVEDGVIVFPKDSVGKMALAEGKLKKHDMTREQLVAEAKHEAEESGRKFNPEKIKSGKTVYEIAGTGAVVLDGR